MEEWKMTLYELEQDIDEWLKEDIIFKRTFSDPSKQKECDLAWRKIVALEHKYEELMQKNGISMGNDYVDILRFAAQMYRVIEGG